MSRAQLIAMTRRHIAHAKARTVDQAPDVARIPASRYTDPEYYAREIDAVFRRVPLMLGASGELREPGSYRALEVMGTPVLLTRDAAGALRGFVNMCSHRGAVVVPEGVGRGRRFMCPYHAWTYDEKGALVGILDEAEFGEIDRSCHGLVALPVAERAGLIFGSIDPDCPVDIDTWLCGYDGMLDFLGLAECHLYGRQSVEGPNWKVAYDGYLDLYHLPILHRNTFGSEMPNKAVYDAWGPHQRVSMPMPGMEALEHTPEEDWPSEGLVAGVWTIFPHVSIAAFDAGGKFFLVSQLFPGETVDTSVTVQHFLTPNVPDEAQREQLDGWMKLLMTVVRDEDYFTGNRIQKALATGLKKEVLFGRNEGGGQRFHAWVEALMQTPDEGLPALMASKVGPEVA
jgi:phenylpropionate dioxygenase-like ring-hydroxylating dioxygenase large terminal subunit